MVAQRVVDRVNDDNNGSTPLATQRFGKTFTAMRLLFPSPAVVLAQMALLPISEQTTSPENNLAPTPAPTGAASTTRSAPVLFEKVTPHECEQEAEYDAENQSPHPSSTSRKSRHTYPAFYDETDNRSFPFAFTQWRNDISPQSRGINTPGDPQRPAVPAERFARNGTIGYSRPDKAQVQSTETEQGVDHGDGNG